MKKVLTTTEFVLWLEDNYIKDMVDAYKIHVEYAKLMQQPPELGMFVPCNGNEPILEPNVFEGADYLLAKNKVLFAGWEFVDEWDSMVGHVHKIVNEDQIIRFSPSTVEHNPTLERFIMNKDITLVPTEAFMERIGL